MAASRRRSTRSSAAVGAGPYICGDQFTAADVYVGSQIGWGMMFGSIDKRPAFEDYFGRLAAAPGRDPRPRARRRADAEQQAAGAAGMSDDDPSAPRSRSTTASPMKAWTAAPSWPS